jgi:hypothetical protein
MIFALSAIGLGLKYLTNRSLELKSMGSSFVTTSHLPPSSPALYANLLVAVSSVISWKATGYLRLDYSLVAKLSSGFTNPMQNTLTPSACSRLFHSLQLP